LFFWLDDQILALSSIRKKEKRRGWIKRWDENERSHSKFSEKGVVSCDFWLVKSSYMHLAV
jgi:hypothetical protein